LNRKKTKLLACVLLQTRLHCCVDYLEGLNNVDVAVSNVFPTENSPLGADSYTLCEKYSGSVTTSDTTTFSCASVTQQYRYVIVRSSDAIREALCIAEVSVYAASASQYAIMFVLVQQPCCQVPHCLYESDCYSINVCLILNSGENVNQCALLNHCENVILPQNRHFWIALTGLRVKGLQVMGYVLRLS